MHHIHYRTAQKQLWDVADEKSPNDFLKHLLCSIFSLLSYNGYCNFKVVQYMGYSFFDYDNGFAHYAQVMHIKNVISRGWNHIFEISLKY